MARSTNPVSPSILAADHATVLALQSMLDYQPLDASLSTAHLIQVQSTLLQAVQSRRALEVALEDARNIEAETSHMYHGLVVRSRAHVGVQYGPDSAAIALIGLKRKSERKRPVRRRAGA